MNYVNYDEVVSQIRLLGLIIKESDLTFDARIQRWKVENEDREKRGWTRLKEWTSKAGHTYIVGSFGIWHGNDDGRVKVELPRRDDPQRPPLTDDDIAAIRASQKETQKKLEEERKREAKQAARWAQTVWGQCIACEEHEYLTRKQIKAHGVRIMGKTEGLVLTGIDDSNHYRLSMAEGALVIPMHDEHANVCGIQFVYPKGHPRAVKIGRDKEFWPSGMAMGGTFGLIGRIKRNGIILVGEGYATMASIHEATGQTCAYAFSANNLVKAGKLLRKTCPHARLLFCADDDYLTQGNPGVTAASEATAVIERSAWIKPDFMVDGKDIREGKKLTDFNDLQVLTGLPLTLATQINAKLTELKWFDPKPAADQPPSSGGGEERKRAQSVMGLEDAIKRFVPLDDGTGKHVFDTWTNKVALKEQMISILPAGVRWDDVKRAPEWIERGAYYMDQVGFDPSGNDKNVQLNTWRGWPMVPKKGRCDCLLDLLSYLCSNEENQVELVQWLLRWMAYPLQNPGAKLHSAVILHGPQGTGKSTIFQTLAKIYGDYATVLNQRGLEDKFNSDWSDSKLFILAEEVVTRAEMWHIKNELKELVTGEWIRINPKNIAAYRQRNQVNVAYLSNENQPLPIENDDRRHCVIYTPPAASEQYYDEIFLELENGGIEAFYHHLMTLDLGDFHPKKRPPMTSAKQALILLSMPSEQRFIHEWTSGDTEWPVCPCLSADLYAAYLKWCRLNGESRPRASNHFLAGVGKMPGWEKKKQRVYDNFKLIGKSEPKPMVFPDPKILAQLKCECPPEKKEIEWLTECVLEFGKVGKDEQWAA